jgi:lactate permease
MLFADLYQQRLDPLEDLLFWSSFWSTVLAALPVVVLFYLLVLRRWLAPWAAAGGTVIAFLVAGLAYSMPWSMVFRAFGFGVAFGILPVGWTIFSAMLLYNVSVESGQFHVVRQSVAALSSDARIQAVLIGFSFGAFLEGAAGGGSPVAICGAIMVGLGFDPFKAAVICLIANTSPVAYGGLGTPLIVLGGVTKLDTFSLSQMAGRQLPFLSIIIPLWMVRCMCSWRQTFAVWPALLVAGGSFSLFQFTFAHLPSLYPMTDIGGGIFSLLVTAGFLRFWKPKDEWHFPKPAGPDAKTPAPASAVTDASREKAHDRPLTTGRVAKAWMPFALMSVLLLGSGLLRQRETIWIREGTIPSWHGLQTVYRFPVPGLHELSARDPELQEDRSVKPEAAIFDLPYLTAPGSAVFFAALLSMALLRMNPRQCWRSLKATVWQMRIPIPTIALMIGLSYLTRYAGLDATLGYAFARSGRLYPFFAAYLGWLGVFLTGTDAGSNALFGSLQKIVADRIWHFTQLTQSQAQILITTANSTGGVMGKMIDAQSICVATAATYQIGREADIFKAVIWHSVALAGIVGLLTLAQAYVPPFTYMVPGR